MGTLWRWYNLNYTSYCHSICFKQKLNSLGNFWLQRIGNFFCRFFLCMKNDQVEKWNCRKIAHILKFSLIFSCLDLIMKIFLPVYSTLLNYTSNWSYLTIFWAILKNLWPIFENGQFFVPERGIMAVKRCRDPKIAQTFFPECLSIPFIQKT